jgi:hypothetical protein
MEWTSWLPIVGGIIFINILLCIVHRCGPKSIVITWIPGKLTMLFIQWFILHRDDIKNLSKTLEYTWASTIIPVLFLNTFHFFLRCYKNREQRFKSKKWLCRWALAIMVVIITSAIVWAICIYDEKRYFIVLLGILALFLNVMNVTDAPEHIKSKTGSNMKFSWCYFLVVNVAIVVILVVIKYLTEQKYFVAAGILSNIPLLAIALLAISALQTQAQASKDIKQQAYMLSYQTWPALGMLAGSWLSIQYINIVWVSFLNGIVILGLVMGIQYCIIKDKF